VPSFLSRLPIGSGRERRLGRPEANGAILPSMSAGHGMPCPYKRQCKVPAFPIQNIRTQKAAATQTGGEWRDVAKVLSPRLD
jgi:hypothetical protein